MPLVTFQAKVEVAEPDRWEPTGEIRQGRPGEFVLQNDGGVDQLMCATVNSHVIMRPKWKPMSWLPKRGWLFCFWPELREHAGSWAISHSEPEQSSKYFVTSDSRSANADALLSLYGSDAEPFVPPPENKVQLGP
jgi:hypothetical protein